MMKNVLFSLLIFCTHALHALTLSSDDAEKIGKRIWQNECRGTMEGLTTWNAGEEFPSFGIAHFIWYPVNKKARFQETFPALIAFFEQEKIEVPGWIKRSRGAPWHSKEEFDLAKESEKLSLMRSWLFKTRGHQVRFLAKRLDAALPKMVEGLNEADAQHLERCYQELAKTPNGLFALIDYLNFKGEGVLTSEQYKEEGWGLKQVLLALPRNQTPTLKTFVLSAKTLLKIRVVNSPPERDEKRWLQGWQNRVDRYVK